MRSLFPMLCQGGQLVVRNHHCSALLVLPRLTSFRSQITAAAHQTIEVRRLGSYRLGSDVKDSSMRKTKSCRCAVRQREGVREAQATELSPSRRSGHPRSQAPTGRAAAPSCKRISTASQSMLEKKASMYLGRSDGL